MSAMKASKVDLSKVTISSLKTLDNGAKMCYVNYNGGVSPMYLQTPEVDIPFDASYYSDNEKSGKYQVRFSLKDLDDNKSIRDFHSKMVEMDNFLKEKALENSVSWFKKAKMSMDTIDSLYTPMVKQHLDPESGEPTGKYPDSFGFKIVKKDGKVQCPMYNEDKVYFDVNGETENPTTVERVLVKGSKVKVVLRCNGVWVANGKFGCTWRAEQMLVKVPDGGLNEFAIQSDSDDEDDVENNVEEKPTNLIDDSDDSSSDNEQEEEVVEEVKPKKKVVRKKVVKKASN
tara:strand:+ start:3666 stop:4526 length:861 start_codon:yes stop_codon:yes gene_type:complete